MAGAEVNVTSDVIRIAKGLSLIYFELEAQWAGRQSEGLVTAAWVYRRKGSVHRIDVGVAGGGSELFCIQCVVSLGPAGRRNVRCCVLSDYAFARAVSPPYVFWLGTSKAQTHLIRHTNYLQP